MANTAESIVFGAISGLVSSGGGTFRCFPDVAPASTIRPYITYQAVGGQSPNYLNNTVDIQNARMQINVWADTRAAASILIQSVIGILTNPATIKGTSIGAPVSTYEPDTKLYGSRSDFSIWYYP